MSESGQVEGRQPAGHQAGPAAAQDVPVRVYQSDGRIMVAAPLPGLEPQDISIEVHGARVTIHGEQRGPRQDERDMLAAEWAIGPYHRELTLPQPVNGAMANATYGNGVLVLTLPKESSGQASPGAGQGAFRLDGHGPARGAHVGHTGHDLRETTTAEHLDGMERSAHRAAGTGSRAGERRDGGAEQIRQDTVRGEAAASRQQRREPDEVTRQSSGSFPASDPPSWSPGIGAPQAVASEAEQTEAAGDAGGEASRAR